MKKILVRIFIGLVVLVIVALLAVFFSLNTIVKKGVETVGPMITKVDVKLGSADISPFSGSGTLNKFSVANPEGYKAPTAMQFEKVKVGVKLGSLASDVITVNEIHVESAEITLEGGLQGNNLSKLLDNINGSSAEAGNKPKPKNAPPQAGASKSSKKFIVKDLLIEGTKVHAALDLPGLGTQSLTVPLPPLHLENIGEAQGGVTAEQLAQAIMKPLFSSIIDAVTKQAGNLGGSLKNLGTNGANGVGNAAKGVIDLFKKKQ